MLEFERKFLIDHQTIHIPSTSTKEHIDQWYNANDDVDSGRCERVRKTTNLVTGVVSFTHTTKDRINDTTRHEYEVELDAESFNLILNNPHNSWYKLSKVRFTFISEGNTVPWEVDIFEGDNVGLCIAEIELSHPDDPIVLPKWISHEITSDMRYTNVQLARVPHPVQ